MNVHGTYIPQSRIESVKSALPAQFTRDDAFAAVCAANVPWDVVPEVTRRLIKTNVDKGQFRPIGGQRYERVG